MRRMCCEPFSLADLGFRSMICCLMVAALVAGCGGKKPSQPKPSKAGLETRAATNTPPVIVTPGGALPGTVSLVNTTGRFVVISFPLGSMPQAGERLGVYRDGLKVGEIRISTWQRDSNAVGDILSGECQRGDQVKRE